MEQEALNLALAAFDFGGAVESAVPYGNGHINHTYLVQVPENPAGPYVLQRVSTVAFPHPEALMDNIIRVTDYLRQVLAENGEDPSRGTLTLLPTRDGKFWYKAPDGAVWRVTQFIKDTYCLETVENADQFEMSARAFGRFQRLLGSFPADTLHETIDRFHDTVNRLNNFKKALAADKLGRAKEVQPEVDFVLAREADCAVCMQALAAGVLPLRVTHNDTKLTNILFDKNTHRGICVLDLDTVMPGLSINDFGDSIRFGANHCAEDERDLSKVNFDLELYAVYAKGFLEEAAGVLTEAEIRYMPWGAKLMTLECGIRFLTDYLEGDVYFHTSRPGQNLDRARTQFKLVSDMEQCWSQMERIVNQYL